MQGYILKVLKAISYIANALLDLETTKINCHRYLGSQSGTLNTYIQ